MQFTTAIGLIFILVLLVEFSLFLYADKGDISRDFALCGIVATILLGSFFYGLQQYTEKVTAETIQIIHEKAEASNKKSSPLQTIKNSERNIYIKSQSGYSSNYFSPANPNSPMSPLNPLSPIYIFD